MGKFFTSEKIQNINVIRFTFNEINLAQREELKNELNETMIADGKKFIIDLSKVGFVSSLVLATLVFFAKEVKQKGGNLKLAGVSSEAYSVFQLTQLDKVFEIHDTEQAAIESFKD
ncbi:MAG: STAS domain-containing protein [Candidatus Omnitrophota bacterium]|jgi:anti-sigma B factor antagonist